MPANKTKPTQQSVAVFLKGVTDPRRRADAIAMAKLMAAASKQKPVMWGPAIVGFGLYHYVYESGREGDMVRIGFSPRKEALVLYLMGGLAPLVAEIDALGKVKRGGGCLYIKSLADVEPAALKRLVAKAWKMAKAL